MTTSNKMTQEQRERRLIEDAPHADRWEFVTTVPASNAPRRREPDPAFLGTELRDGDDPDEQ
jgi:hypothetical protein